MRKKTAKIKYIIGIDEAGRGPLCGPVAVGGFIIQKKTYSKLKKYLPGLTDSKKLSEKKRDELFRLMKQLRKQKQFNFSVALIGEKIIDEKGIATAIKTGVKRVLTSLTKNIDPEEILVLLDGGLKAPDTFQNQKTIIKGDLKESAISAASVAAKVSRDLYMKKIAAKYPEYKFEVHKGYGTLEHRRLIKKYGLSAVHRRSFCKNML